MQDIGLPLALELYERFRAPLAAVRDRMRRLYRRKALPWTERSLARRACGRALALLGRGGAASPMLAQLDDIGAELTYLLLRHTRPERVVEVSPCHGWSTCWILAALRDNGGGELHSFDLIDAATNNVPRELAAERWHFHKGDVRALVAELPGDIDYLFVDSDHSASFAQWYLAELFPRVRPGAVVSVDDVYHYADPGQFDGEGRVIVDWLVEHETPYFCASSEGFKTEQNAIHAQKLALGLGHPVRPCTKNPTIFFVMPGLPARSNAAEGRTQGAAER